MGLCLMLQNHVSVFTFLISVMISCCVASTSREDKKGQQLGANVFSLGHNKGIVVSKLLSHFTIVFLKIEEICILIS